MRLIFLFLLVIPSTLAISIGVSPATVEIKTGKGIFHVINPNPEPVWFDIISQSTTAKPSSGILKPYERRKIDVITPFFFYEDHMVVHLKPKSGSLLPAMHMKIYTSESDRLHHGIIITIIIVILGIICTIGYLIIFSEKL